MEQDAGRDRSGDEAAWLDLVARLELPTSIDPASAPWPDRESLGPVARPHTAAPGPEASQGPGSPDDAGTGSGDGGSAGPGPSAPGAADSGPDKSAPRARDTAPQARDTAPPRDAAQWPAVPQWPEAAQRRQGTHAREPRHSREPGRSSRPRVPRPPEADLGAAATDAATGTAGAPGESPGTEPSRPGRHRGEPTSRGRGRVIRPASYFRFTILPGPERAEADHAESPERIGRPGGLIAPDWTGLSEAGGVGLDRPDYLDDPAELDLLGYDDDRYVPPPIPPFPRPDATTRAAWAGLFGGPAFLFIATLFGWTVSAWVELLAIAAFIVGFVVLVVRLGDGPSRGDGPDQGAVV